MHGVEVEGGLTVFCCELRGTAQRIRPVGPNDLENVDDSRRASLKNIAIFQEGLKWAASLLGAMDCRLCRR